MKPKTDFRDVSTTLEKSGRFATFTDLHVRTYVPLKTLFLLTILSINKPRKGIVRHRAMLKYELVKRFAINMSFFNCDC